MNFLAPEKRPEGVIPFLQGRLKAAYTVLNRHLEGRDWIVGAAPTILNADGVPFLEPVTEQQVADALSAASAVGDDRIQSATTGQVTPESWTHGSGEMRQRWFLAGLNGGPNACNTFEVSGSEL